MSEPVIKFVSVYKNYPLYSSFTNGIKNFLFHFPKSLYQVYKKRVQVLKNISLKIYRGEAVGFIGRNGAGKSTILSLIAGVIKPSAGQITVKGRVSPLLELGAGFHFELTGRENIILNGVLLGLTKKEVLSRLEDIIAFSELGDFIDQPIRTYSSGMLARLGFSVIAHLDPDILLIDEMLAVGDRSFQEKCLLKMQEFKQRKVTMVFVSHSMDDVVKICDRVYLIEDGIIKYHGEPEDVVLKYTTSK